MPYQRRFTIRERLAHRHSERLYKAQRALRDEFSPMLTYPHFGSYIAAHHARLTKALYKGEFNVAEDQRTNTLLANAHVDGLPAEEWEELRNSNYSSVAADPSPWAQIDDDDLNKVVEIWKRQGER